MTSKVDMDACWKDALLSRPEGSFIFPENVVVEELFEHIDNTWTAHWEGTPRVEELQRTSSCQSSSNVTSASAESEAPPAAKKPQRSWLRRTVAKIHAWRQKPETNDAADPSALAQDNCYALMPRYPSWADFSQDDEIALGV